MYYLFTETYYPYQQDVGDGCKKKSRKKQKPALEWAAICLDISAYHMERTKDRAIATYNVWNLNTQYKLYV